MTVTPITERAITAAQMVRQHGVTVAQAAACLRVPVAMVQVALGAWVSKRGAA